MRSVWIGGKKGQSGVQVPYEAFYVILVSRMPFAPVSGSSLLTFLCTPVWIR
jgi:hypothetical protein